jgi:futalosine hydrolase
MPRILVVTAVEPEREAVLGNYRHAVGALSTGAGNAVEVHRAVTGAGPVDVVVGGVGPSRAAATAAMALRVHYDLLVCAGIAGGFPPAEAGSLVVADAVAHADLGADTPDGFSSIAELGLGDDVFDLDPAMVAEAARRTGGLPGAILTVSTVTGTADRALQLIRRYPSARAEAMEGAGVLAAARLFGTPFLEIRAISNPVGPRDRSSWRISGALTALSTAFGKLFAEPLTATGPLSGRSPTIEEL